MGHDGHLQPARRKDRQQQHLDRHLERERHHLLPGRELELPRLRDPEHGGRPAVLQLRHLYQRRGDRPHQLRRRDHHHLRCELELREQRRGHVEHDPDPRYGRRDGHRLQPHRPQPVGRRQQHHHLRRERQQDRQQQHLH